MRSAITRASLLIALVILGAILTGAVAVWSIDPWKTFRGDPSQRESEPGGSRDVIDPAWIQYHQTGDIPAQLQEPRAVATGPDGRVYVAGDKAVHVVDAEGTKRSEIALDDRPRCLAVGGPEHAAPGRIYVGMADHVEVFGADGTREKTWDSLGEKALLTSIAAAEDDVFVADAGNRIVLRYDTSGELLGRIGTRDDRRKIPGFRITSAHFDLGVGPDGLLRVVNPLMRRIEAYTFDGDLEFSWGNSASGIEGFFGCCNPAHFAMLPDGRFVTAEKGIPRIKVYDAKGRFVCVVAGPEQMPTVAADLAVDVGVGQRVDAGVDAGVDGQDRILVLDPKTKSVRIFEHNGLSGDSSTDSSSTKGEDGITEP